MKKEFQIPEGFKIPKTGELGIGPIVELPDGTFASTDGEGNVLDIWYPMPDWVECPVLGQDGKPELDEKGKPKTVWMR